MVFAAPLSGAISDRIGPRTPTVLGMVVTAVSLVALALAFRAPATDLGAVTAALVGFGFGQGLFTPPNNSAVMGAAPPQRLGAAGGILNVTRSLGTSLGVAASSALMTWQLASGTALLAATCTVVWMFVALALLVAGMSASRNA